MFRLLRAILQTFETHCNFCAQSCKLLRVMFQIALQTYDEIVARNDVDSERTLRLLRAMLQTAETGCNCCAQYCSYWKNLQIFAHNVTHLQFVARNVADSETLPITLLNVSGSKQAFKMLCAIF